MMQVLDDSAAMLKTLSFCRHTNPAIFDAVERAFHQAKAMGTDKLARHGTRLFSAAVWCSVFRMVGIVTSLRYSLAKR